MDYALEERIGNPDLFTGREKELDYFLKWINDIKERKSQSTALLARRKMGKTALMERLFNITFYKNDRVIPFYYEIKERDVWIVDFCVDFFLAFIYQYMAFKSRKVNYLGPDKSNSLEEVKKAAVNEGLDYLIGTIKNVEYAVNHDHVDLLWETVREAPKIIAFSQKEFILQMIDEFQFMNALIYRDKALKNLAKNLAGGYLSTAESKVAPLLVSGSWVGWLMDELKMMLPARFRYKSLKNMPENEAIEMLFKYSRFFDVPITEETAYLIARLSEGSPFYISSIIRSDYEDKDLTTVEGLTGTLEFETLDDHGSIKSTWMEYIKKAFRKVNHRHAKTIVLYLCKQKDQEVTRKELQERLNLDMPDADLEKKMEALVKADIIEQGVSHFRYRGVKDNIFDKVFRGVYQEEIEGFEAGEIKKEYRAAFEKLKKQYTSLLGKFNYQKGYFAEYLILDQLTYHAREKNELLKSITRHLPPDFNFCDYSRVWRYSSSPEYKKGFSVDIFTRPENAGDYSIIGEVKSKESRKFSKDEVLEFEKKFREVKKLENIKQALGFIFSRSGFTRDAEDYCKEKGIACSEDERWLEI
ncbi:MAG: hypothetical protein JSV88_18345 [Candidatus Aminicenantes bacterium]|nr:MAG: hypothetical protein JSV88_18345 [Candidatus Aminicenantes bacterium]